MSSSHSPVAHHHPIPEEPVSSLLISTWHMLHQVPPPTLREILGAYNQKGNGDREMLLAMLNAKSAEDQRLASLVTLYQTLLQAQYSPQPPTPHNAARSMQPNLLLSPPNSFAAPPSPTSLSQASGSRSSSSASPRSRSGELRDSLTLPPIHQHLAGVERTQKRRRTDSGESYSSSQIPPSHMRYQGSPAYSGAPSPSDSGSVGSESKSRSRKGSGRA